MTYEQFLHKIGQLEDLGEIHGFDFFEAVFDYLGTEGKTMTVGYGNPNSPPGYDLAMWDDGQAESAVWELAWDEKALIIRTPNAVEALLCIYFLYNFESDSVLNVFKIIGESLHGSDSPQ